MAASQTPAVKLPRLSLINMSQRCRPRYGAIRLDFDVHNTRVSSTKPAGTAELKYRVIEKDGRDLKPL